MSSNDNEISVRIVGDASGVAPAIQQAKGEVGGLDESIRALNASMQALAAQMSAGMAKATGMAKEAHAATVQAAHGAHEAEEGFAAMGHNIHEAAESVRTFQMRAKEFAELYVGIFAVEQVVEFAKGLAEVAEQTKHTAEQFGMTTDEVQQLNGIAKLTGVSVETLTKGFAIMDRGLVNSKGATTAQANAFKEMGISIDDGLSQMQKFAVISDKFKTLEDGPKKAALAMLLFGKSGKELIPVLNEGSAGLDELIAKTKEYGGINKEAVTQGGLLAEAMNTSGLAMQGLKNTLTQEFAPVLTEMVDGFNNMVKAMIDSYNAGGVVKTAFDIVSAAASGVVSIVTFAKTSFAELFSSSSKSGMDWKALFLGIMDAVVVAIKACIAIVVMLASAFKIGFEAIIGYAKFWYANLRENLENAGLKIDELKMQFGVWKTAVTNAFTQPWGTIAANWDAGMKQIQSVVHRRGQAIIDEARKAKNEAMGLLAGANADGASLRAYFLNLDKKPGQEKPTGMAMPKGPGGDIELGKTSKPKKEKKPKAEKGPSELETWKSDLADQLLLEKNWGVDEQAFSKSFWSEKIALTKTGSKEWLEIHRIMQTESKALGKEQKAEDLARIKEQIAAEIDAAKTSFELAKLGIQAKIDGASEDQKAGKISAVELARIKRDLNGELIALDVDLINREFALKLAGMKAELAVAHMAPAEQKKINKEIELLEAQHQTALTVAAAKGAKERAKGDAAVMDAQRQRYKSMAKTFGDALGSMITMQKSFAATINGLWSSLMNTIAQAISNMVVKWVTSILVGMTAEKAAHMQAVKMHAKTAAASAYKAVAGIPVVGPFLAPIAAAAAFAGVMAFSAKGGMGDVPYDDAPFLLHKNEMVLPASLANPMRAMLSGSAANGNAPMAANQNGGDTIHHYEAHFHGPADKSAVAAWFKENAVGVAAATDHGIRSGYIPRHM
jgi:hypothetical protein